MKSLNLKDALGREVRENHVIFVVRGSYKSVLTGLAVVTNAATAQIRPVCMETKRVWDEPAGKTEYQNATGSYRKSHTEKVGYALRPKTNLQLGFSRSVIIDITELEDDDMFTFLNAGGQVWERA